MTRPSFSSLRATFSVLSILIVSVMERSLATSSLGNIRWLWWWWYRLLFWTPAPPQWLPAFDICMFISKNLCGIQMQLHRRIYSWMTAEIKKTCWGKACWTSRWDCQRGSRRAPPVYMAPDHQVINTNVNTQHGDGHYSAMILIFLEFDCGHGLEIFDCWYLYFDKYGKTHPGKPKSGHTSKI